METGRVLRIIDPDWLTCQRCPLHQTAHQHVLFDGSPDWQQARNLDILLVGEGPGRSEDLLGRPFVGRAGKLLREALSESGWMDGDLTWGMTNLVACRPCNGRLEGNRPPNPQEIEACWPRLLAVVQASRPVWVVLLGRVPQGEAERFNRLGVATYGMTHPAALSRQGGKSSPAYRVMVTYLKRMAKACRAAKEVVACG